MSYPTYRYTTLLFDADGTLFDYQKASWEALRCTLEQFSLPFSQELFTLYQEKNQALWDLYELGEVTKEQLEIRRFVHFFEAAGMTGALPAEVNEAYIGYLGQGAFLLPGALELIDSLKGSFGLYLVTNGLKRVQYRRLESSPLVHAFDGVFVSEETGYQKPQKGYFDYVFARIPEQDRAQMLIIGDSLSSDIRGGNNAGIDTCWLNPSGSENTNGAVCTYEIGRLEELYEILPANPREQPRPTTYSET